MTFLSKEVVPFFLFYEYFTRKICERVKNTKFILRKFSVVKLLVVPICLAGLHLKYLSV